jgi:hypothetical protein
MLMTNAVVSNQFNHILSLNNAAKVYPAFAANNRVLNESHTVKSLSLLFPPKMLIKSLYKSKKDIGAI